MIKLNNFWNIVRLGKTLRHMIPFGCQIWFVRIVLHNFKKNTFCQYLWIELKIYMEYEKQFHSTFDVLLKIKVIRFLHISFIHRFSFDLYHFQVPLAYTGVGTKTPLWIAKRDSWKLGLVFEAPPPCCQQPLFSLSSFCPSFTYFLEEKRQYV